MNNRLKTLKNKRNTIGKRISNILSRKHNGNTSVNVAVGTNGEDPLSYKMSKQTAHPSHKTDVILWEGTVGDLRKAKDQAIIKWNTIDPATGNGYGRQLKLIDLLDLVRMEQRRLDTGFHFPPENPHEIIQFGVDIRNKNPYEY